MSVVPARLAVPITAVMLFLAACEDEGANGDGNNDTLFTGLSGLVILIVIGFFVLRAFRNRG